MKLVKLGNSWIDPRRVKKITFETFNWPKLKEYGVSLPPPPPESYVRVVVHDPENVCEVYHVHDESLDSVATRINEALNAV